MEIRIYNDFDSVPTEKGRLYTMETEDGSASVINHVFDEGFVVNRMDFETSYLTNQDRIGEMDYLMIYVTLMGRLDMGLGDNMTSRLPGTACIYHPSGMRCHMKIPSGRHIGLAIGLNISTFELSESSEDGLPFNEMVEQLMECYVPYQRIHLNNREMVDIYMMWNHLEHGHDPVIIHRLVSDFVLSLYSSVEGRDLDRDIPSSHRYEDLLCNTLISDGDGRLDIKGLCNTMGVDRYDMCARFSNVYGRTPYAFYKYHRMVKAASMIGLGDASIGDVALNVGYSNESKFAEAFRKEFGCRPKHFKTVLDQPF